MPWGEPEVDSDLCPFHPLSSLWSATLLDMFVGDIHWASEVVSMFGVLLDICFGVQRVSSFLATVVQPWCCVDRVICRIDGIWLQVWGDCVRPPFVDMDH